MEAKFLGFRNLDGVSFYVLVCWVPAALDLNTLSFTSLFSGPLQSPNRSARLSAFASSSQKKPKEKTFLTVQSLTKESPFVILFLFRGPQRIRVFIWIVIKERVMMNAERWRRGFAESDLYPMCYSGTDMHFTHYPTKKDTNLRIDLLVYRLLLHLLKRPKKTFLTVQSLNKGESFRGFKANYKMEGIGGDGASMASPMPQWGHDAWRMFQYYLDKSTPHSTYRWIGTLGVVAIYFLRVYYVQGFYIVSYGLGIYLLNLLIGFLSPLVDPELESSDGALLPTKGSDEFKPFIRRLPEFKFWYAMTKAFCIAFLMTFFSVFDVPVFWPILLCYWIVLFVLTMRRQIGHMIKYKYLPFSIGKQKYSGKRASASSSRGD